MDHQSSVAHKITAIDPNEPLYCLCQQVSMTVIQTVCSLTQAKRYIYHILSLFTVLCPATVMHLIHHLLKVRIPLYKNFLF